MKLLIIGSTGFIGQHVTRSMAEHDCYTADIAGAATERHTALSKADLSEFSAIMAAVRPDVCVNCAGAAHVGASFQDPARDYDLNVGIVQALLEAIRVRSPGTRFVNMSSAAVYGNPGVAAIDESTPTAPISPYGWHKLTAEMLCREYRVCFGLPTTSLRLFSVFGSGLRKQLYWDVFGKARSGKLVTFSGTGSETRDYIHVQDVVGALRAVIDRAPFEGEAINVAAGAGVSTHRAVTSLLQAIRWDGQIIFDGQERLGDPCHWKADITKLARLGFRCRYTFEDGIREVAQWLNSLP